MKNDPLKYIGQMIYDNFSTNPAGLGWVEKFSYTRQYTIHWQDGSTTKEYTLFVMKCRDNYLALRKDLV